MNRLSRRFLLCAAGSAFCSLAHAAAPGPRQLLLAAGNVGAILFAFLCIAGLFLIWRMYFNILRSPSAGKTPARQPDLTPHGLPYYDFVQWTRNVLVDQQPRAYAKGVLLRFSSTREALSFPYDSRRWRTILDDLISQSLEITPRGSRIEFNLDISPPGEVAEVIIRLQCEARSGAVPFMEPARFPSRQLINDMGGSLVIQMVPGQGREFILRSPIPLPSFQEQAG